MPGVILVGRSVGLAQQGGATNRKKSSPAIAAVRRMAPQDGRDQVQSEY